MTNLEIRHQQVDRIKLPRLLDEAACGTGAPSYFINLTLDNPEFVVYSTSLLETGWSDRTFGGRLFGPNAEFEWLQNGNRFEVWTLTESLVEPRGDDVSFLKNLVPNNLKYYCIGTWNPNPWLQCFRDGRLPQKLRYPMNGSSERDRLFFSAIAYSPSMPTVSVDPEEVMKVLNQPRIVAYRLIGIDADCGTPGINPTHEVQSNAC